MHKRCNGSHFVCNRLWETSGSNAQSAIYIASVDPEVVIMVEITNIKVDNWSISHIIFYFNWTNSNVVLK